MNGFVIILIGVLLLLSGRVYGSTLIGRAPDPVEILALITLIFSGFLLILVGFVVIAFGL